MKRIVRNISNALVLTLVVISLLWPIAGDCAVTIRATYVPAAANGLDPNDAAWNVVPQYTVALDTVITAAGAPQLLPSSKWRFLRVKAMHNGADIFFRFQWPDATQDTEVADGPLFADAVALEIPYNAIASSIAMGNQFEPVNIIYWRADLPNPQNIVSGGAGTVQKSPDSDGPPPLVSHFQQWTSGTWTVIFKRAMTGPAVDSTGKSPGNMVTLVRGANYRITFAQWDGGNQERKGVKLVAGSWQTLFVQ